jgi:hypothetical protein
MSNFNHKGRKGFHKGHKALRVISCNLIYFTLVFCLSPFPLFSQISQGGTPLSFIHLRNQEVPVITLPSPDLSAIRSADVASEKMALPRRIAVPVAAGITPEKDGQWVTMPDGTRVWHVKVICEGALAISMCFDHFRLTQGSRLFIYNENRDKILGAYTLLNNSKNNLFATELIPGESATIELEISPGSNELPDFYLTEISYAYRDVPVFVLNLGSSDPCEVNINCPEGDNWQKQKRGVVKIYVKDNGSFFWCSGSLVNNALQDLQPFLITADHCGPEATPDDLSQWVFYFNYEAPECETPAGTPASSTMTGAVKLSSASTTGSDFLLIRLNEDVPQNYQPYFNGWSAENIASTSGVSIHHPAGDIKKISTYTDQLTSSQWSSIPNTHWQVIWSETANGWGVTEGGSSGAPLFDNNGRIIGTLTGGMASCEPGGGGAGTGPDQPDYYGKFSFSWDQNGSAPEQQLKYWLDPYNTGITSLPGMNSSLSAGFVASETILLSGGLVHFTNQSSGIPDSWEWTFEGGNPATYLGQDPPDIQYANGGVYDVGLVVSDGEKSDSLLLKDYIQVVGRIYPNPATDEVNIYLDADLPADIFAEVFNALGQKVLEKDFSDQATRLINLDVSNLAAGIYSVRLTVKQHYIFGKFLKIQR